MTLLAMLAFWLSLAALVYLYAGVPLLVAIVGRLRRREVWTDAITPPVSLLIAAYNEEAVIADRLANVLALDYPRDRLEVLVPKSPLPTRLT